MIRPGADNISNKHVGSALRIAVSTRERQPLWHTFRITHQASVEFLTAETRENLGAFGKRLILARAITTKALFVCAGTLIEQRPKPSQQSPGADNN
jgi:hypothetical protein